MPTKREKYHALVNHGVNPFEAAVRAGYTPHRTTLKRLVASDPPPSPLQAALKLLPADLQDFYASSKEAQRHIKNLMSDGESAEDALAYLPHIREWEAMTPDQRTEWKAVHHRAPNLEKTRMTLQPAMDLGLKAALAIFDACAAEVANA